VRIDTDMECWDGNIGPQKYRFIIDVKVIRDYGTDKEIIVENNDKKKQLLEKWICDEHAKINTDMVRQAGFIGKIPVGGDK